MKKTKLEEVTISDKPKHTMLWNLMDVEPQQMEKEIDLTLEAFANMSAWIVNELYDELYQWKSWVVSLEDKIKQHEHTIGSLQ